MTRPPLFISRSSRGELVRSPRRTRAVLYLVALTAAAIGFVYGYRSGAEARPIPSLRITPPTPRVHLEDPAIPQAAPVPDEEPAPRILFIRC